MSDVLTPAMRAFLQETRFAVLATVGAGGMPHQTAMWYVLEADEIVFNTRRGRVKDRNLRRDARVSLCFEDGYRYLTIAGEAWRVDDADVGQSDIQRIAARYEGADTAARMMRDTFSRQERVSYRVRVTRVYGEGFEAEAAE